MSTLRVSAYAKINLFLKIGPRRADGYHSILTIFQSISLADDIALRYDPRGRGLRLTMADDRPDGGSAAVDSDVQGAARRIPTGPDNTVSKAYRFLCREVPAARRGGFSVRVTKRIPSGAGLGGGSADAAGFLAGAARLLGVRLPDSPAFLKRLARDVGADVPFCLRGGTAIGAGRGEVLRFLPALPPRLVILAAPRTPILTAAAYRRLDAWRRKNLTTPVSAHTLNSVMSAVRKRRPVKFLLNDFQPPACRTHPELALIAAHFSQEGIASMSGSGSAFFVLPLRRFALRRLRNALPGVSIRQTRLVARGYRFGNHGSAYQESRSRG